MLGLNMDATEYGAAKAGVGSAGSSPQAAPAAAWKTG